MAYLENKAIIVGKEEGTPGVAEALTSADFNSRISDPTFTPNIETVSTKYATGDHAGGDVIIGRQSGDFGFSSMVNTGGVPAAPPQFSKWLKGCGLNEVAFSGFGYFYEPEINLDESCLTIAKYLIERGPSPKAKEYRYAGCFGNFVFKADNIGAPLQLDFTYKGKYNNVSDIANASTIATLTGDDNAPGVAFINADVTIGGTPVCISSFSFDAGNDVQGEPCQSDKSGYIKFGRVSANDPTLSMTIMQKSVADFNEMLAMETGANFEVVIKINTPIPITFSVWKGQLIAIPHSNNDGISSLDVQFKAKRDVGSANTQGVYGLLIGTTS